MKELKVLRGQNSLLFEGITNIAELKEFAMEKSKEYENIIVTDDNYKLCEETIKEIKPYRTEVKKYRASVNKELKRKSGEILAEIDSVTNIFSEVIDPVTEKVAKYKEKVKQDKIEKKKAKFEADIEALNLDLNILSESLPFTTFTPIEFDDKWASKKDSDIVDCINEVVESYKTNIRAKQNRFEAIKTQAELLKVKLDLKTDVNYLQLKHNIYADDWKESLEQLAYNQQEIELTAIAKEQEEQQIKKEIEENKIKKETEKLISEIKKEDIKEVNIKLFLNSEQDLAFKKFLKENNIKFEMLK